MFARLVCQPTDQNSILFNTQLFSWSLRSYDLKSQASNPRDYIYALIGVSDDCTLGEVVPNYDERKESVREAFLKVIPVCLRMMKLGNIAASRGQPLSPHAVYGYFKSMFLSLHGPGKWPKE